MPAKIKRNFVFPSASEEWTNSFREGEFCPSPEGERWVRLKAALLNLFCFTHEKRQARRKKMLAELCDAELKALSSPELPFSVSIENYLAHERAILAGARWRPGATWKKTYIQKRERRLAQEYRMCAGLALGLPEQEKNNARVQELREIVKKRKLRVAFLVLFESMFPAEPVFRKMRESKFFEPVLYVIPDVSHGEEHMFAQMLKTYTSLKEKYENVLLTYDAEHKEFLPIGKDFDLFCTATPYDATTHEYYGIRNLVVKQNKLSFYVNYGHPGVVYGRKVFALQALSLPWKYFIESEILIPEYRRNMPLCGINTELVGYAKMDALAQCRMEPGRTFKRVILAPHHTIDNKSSLQLSNFLNFADFFLELPRLYPHIRFVFRPHPVLFIKLAHAWGKKKAREYLAAMQNLPNVEYQDGGDYFETFAHADGIIHDCSSFLTEWMYTEKPGCYLLRSKESIHEQFMPAGQAVLDLYYQAFGREDILRFLDDVILQGKDPLKEKRETYARRFLKVNYPKVAEKIVSSLEKAFLSAGDKDEEEESCLRRFLNLRYPQASEQQIASLEELLRRNRT